MVMSKWLNKYKSDRIFYQEALAADKIAMEILPLLPINNQPIICVCIGTDRSTGDSLGPLVGSDLMEYKNLPFYVYGTLESPIHAVNLEENLKMIYENHSNPFIIAIDACLGNLKSVGSIQIGKGPLKPGAGVHKTLPEVGDIHITGIVNISGFMEFFVLQNTRLYLVINMAKKIAKGIRKTAFLYQKEQHMFSINKHHGQYEDIIKKSPS